MRVSLLSAVAVGFACLAVPPLSAQTERDVVRRQLDEVAREMQPEGFATTRAFDGRSAVGMLPRHGSVLLEVQLRAGTEYFVAGVCDEHCSDLDLHALAPDGTVLDDDVEMDDVPVLAFRASETGPHLIGVVMSACRVERCWFGVRVMAR